MSRPTASVPLLRRSTRLKTLPASYAPPDPAPEEDEEMEDVEEPFLAAVSRKKPVGPPLFFRPHPRKRQRNSLDDGNATFSQQRKKLHPVGSTHSDKEEQLLRRTCEDVGIDYKVFDEWVEDPRLKAPETMNLPFLPNEILLQIFSECRSEVLVECMKTCKRFYGLLKDNTKLWRQARMKHYSSAFGKILPFGLDEYELFELATGKKCDYCQTHKRVKAYYIWSVRACLTCIRSLTLYASEFKRMLKKKVGGSPDWDTRKRELICSTIRWQDLPSGARICWKEEAYNRINEAEEMMLDDKFEEWVVEKSTDWIHLETYWILEEWGTDIPKKMKMDRDSERAKVRASRGDVFTAWANKILPNPIPKKTLQALPTYQMLLNKPSYLTKREFILHLPRILRDRSRLDDRNNRNRALERQSRLRHDDLLEQTVHEIIHTLIRDGDVSAGTWDVTIKLALKAAAEVGVEVKFPVDTPPVIIREWKWRHEQNDLGIPHLVHFSRLLENALDRNNSEYSQLLHPSVHEFFETGQDRVFICPGTSIEFEYFGAPFKRCRQNHRMTLGELAEHLYDRGCTKKDLTHLIVGKWGHIAIGIQYPRRCIYGPGGTRRESMQKTLTIGSEGVILDRAVVST